jgi:hypothetical protein
MQACHTFPLTTLGRVIKLAALTPLLLISQGALALEIVDGTTRTLNASTPLDNFLVRNAGSLTAQGAKTEQIRAETGSSVSLNGTEVTAQAGANAMELSASQATIAGSQLVSDQTGLRLLETAAGGGATALVTDKSEITGGQIGVSLSAKSQLALVNATVTGSNATGIGIESFGGNVSAKDSKIVGGSNGVSLFTHGNLSPENALILDHSHVEGLSGSAIVVDGLTQTNTERANIEVNNQSTLKGGNGVLLEVINGSSASFKADNSQLVGDIVVADGSRADVVLDHSATLTGRLENVENLDINNAARWVMIGDASVENLSLNGGAVQFGNPGQYFNLSVATLSGTGGTFDMHTDFNTGQVDTLTVTGIANGSHTLAIDASGSEPVGAGSIAVVQIGGGDAQFVLEGGEVDLGAFSYDLIKQGDTAWYLNSASKVISPGTQSVMALFNAAPIR